MTPVRFENRLKLVNGTVGKLILCLDGDVLALNGAMKQHVLAQSPTWDAFDRIDAVQVGALVGQHQAIYGEGWILGGNQALFANNTLLIRNYSSTYGTLHPEAIQRCLHSVAAVTYKDEWNIGFEDGLPPLERWIEQAIAASEERRRRAKAQREEDE